MKKLFATSLALILAVSFFVWHRTLPEPAGRPLPVASSAKPEVPAIHREKPQQALKSKGLYNGPVNGVMNDETRTAITNDQKQNNLPANGQLTPQTIESLGIKHPQK